MRNKNRLSLVTRLQADIVDSGVPISDVLRRARILASLLGNDELKRWVRAELEGYQSVDDLPDYRKFTPINMGTFAGPFGRIVKNHTIPIAFLPPEIQRFAKRLDFRQGAKEIEALAARTMTKEGFRTPWPAEVVILAQDHIHMEDGSVLVEAWKPIIGSQLHGILDQIRNRLLDFLLELKQINPEVAESEDAIRDVRSDVIQNIISTTIYGGQNTVAAGTNFVQNLAESVSTGNLKSLIARLRDTGLDNNMLAELETAVTEDGNCQRNKFGKHVTSWIGKAITKAMDGTWKIATNTAPRILQEALFQYYGWK